jgi:small-conductance mechanosensitive channel
MLGVMPLVPYDLGGDISAFFGDFGLIILGVIIMFVAMLYGLAYFSRYVEFQKLKESKYLDESILNTINKAVHVVVVFVVIMISIVIIQTRSDAVRGALISFFEFFPAIFVVIVVLFTFYVFMKVLERLIIALRKQVSKGDEKIETSRFLSLTEIFIKYTIYTVGILFAIFGGLAALPSGDMKNWVVDNIFGPLGTKWQSFVFVAITILVAYILYMFVDSVLEDIKKRSKKFSPRVIDVFRSLSKYIFLFVTGVIIALILLSTVVSETETYVIGIAFAITASGILISLAGPIRNVLSGIVMMMADPFDEGDRVKILDHLVCDVLQMNLTLTTVKSLRGEVINIPNDEIMSKSIINFTRSGTYAMTVQVNVSYQVPHEQVEEILIKAAERTDGIADSPNPAVFGRNVEGNTITHQLLAYIEQPEDMKKVKSELVYNIQDIFHENGITALFKD